MFSENFYLFSLKTLFLKSIFEWQKTINLQRFENKTDKDENNNSIEKFFKLPSAYFIHGKIETNKQLSYSMPSSLMNI